MRAAFGATFVVLIGLSFAVSGAAMLWDFDAFAADVRTVVEYVASRGLESHQSRAVESGSLDIVIVHGPPTVAARGIQLMILAMVLGGLPAAILAIILARRADARGTRYSGSWAQVFLAGFIFQLGSIIFASIFFLVFALEFMVQPNATFREDWPLAVFEGGLFVIVLFGLIALRSWRSLRASAVPANWIDLTTAIALVVSFSAAPLSEAQGIPSFDGRLYHSVFDGSTDSPFSNNDRANVPVSLRVRFDNFVRCRASFRSSLPAPATFFEKAASIHRRPVERALTCLFETPEIAAAATEYARNARILYEWEGMSDSPIEEASYAEAYVARHPRSPFLPYLYLFAAQRWRCAFEYFVRDRDSEGIINSSAKYRELITRARKADPLIQLVANDLDGLPYLTSDVGRHPRDP